MTRANGAVKVVSNEFLGVRMQRSVFSIRTILTLAAVVVFAGNSVFHYVDVDSCRAVEQDVNRLPEIKDKTLVAWVVPSNLIQRGGGVLTLIDVRERFDSIVFGEISTGKWMAGSDFFRRTQQDQSSYPSETADARTLVQLAIVYRGNEIVVYRNGNEYARHRVDRPQAFGGNNEVIALIGLRYLGGNGEIGYFAGQIEEARIYDVALTAEQVAALRPNNHADRKPLGCWTFEDGTGKDVMGNFPAGQVQGNTRIADGRLHLDGESGYVVCRPPEPPLDRTPQPMFYKARSRQTGNMWDTWLYLHQGKYYLFCLAKAGPKWNNISMATSPDGVHWSEHGRVLHKGAGVTWMGTGSTWKSPAFDRDGKFFLNFSEWKGPRQTIFFAESADLLNWERLDDEHEFVQNEKWYEQNGRWDCIWTIVKPEGGGLYGYWTATPKAETGGRFGFGQSNDGVTWEALTPPKVYGVGAGEVGAIQRIGGRYYMMFGTGGKMVTLMADQPQGPFRAAEKNLEFLAGHTYFSRFFPTPDGLLANHHAIARNGQVYFAPLKSTVIDSNGTLRLGWWQGNERMKHKPLDVSVSENDGDTLGAIAMLDHALDVEYGIVLEGKLRLPETNEASRRGLYVEYGENSGSAILLNAAGRAELGSMQGDGTGFQAEKKVDREMSFAQPAGFRLLVRHSLLEFYLDDILIECFSLPERATGRIGLLHGGDPDSFTDVKAWSAR